MTGTPAGRKERRRVAALVAASLVLASCDASPAAPPAPTIVPAAAPTSPFALPALTDDGNSFPKAQIVPTLVPRVLDGPTADRGPREEWESWPEDEKDADRPDVDAFPDDEELLRGLAVRAELRDGALTFTGTDADSAGRVLAAAAAAVRRTYRVEVRAVRVWPGRPAPTAAAVLSAEGARVLARFDGAVRDGAVAITAARDDVTFPADVDLENVTAAPHAMRFGVGSAFVLSPARVDGRRAILRLTFHETHLLGERRIAGDDVERDAPLLAMVALAGEMPAANGVATVAVADSGDPETSFAIAWRVTTSIEAAPTPGALGVSLHADQALVRIDRPPRPGTIDLTDEVESPDTLELPDVPRGLPLGVRAVVARPGILVTTGADDTLARVRADLESARVSRLAPAVFRIGRTTIPFVVARGAVLVQARITPFAGEVEVDIAQESCTAAARTGWLFGGRSILLRPEGDRVVAEIHGSSEASVAPGVGVMARADDEGDRTVRDAFDVVKVRSSSLRVALRVGEPKADEPDGTTFTRPVLETLPW